MEIFEQLFEKFNLKDKFKGEDYDNFVKEFKESYNNTVLKVFGEKVKKANAPSKTCSAKTKKGEPCKLNAFGDSDLCKRHKKISAESSLTKEAMVAKCNGKTKKGVPCTNRGKVIEGAQKVYCFRHAKDWKKFENEDFEEFE